MADEIQIIPEQFEEEISLVDPIAKPIKQLNIYEEDDNTIILARPIAGVTIRFVSSGAVVRDSISIGKQKKSVIHRKIAEKKPIYDHNFQIRIEYAWSWSKRTQDVVFSGFSRAITVVSACAFSLDKSVKREPAIVVLSESWEPKKYDAYIITPDGVQIERTISVGILPKTTLRG